MYRNGFNQFKSRTLNCQGQLLSLDSPVIMGILNVNPDSFYNPSKYTEEKMVLEAAESMIINGVSILDIGGMSSRPGSVTVDKKTEAQRVVPMIRTVKKHFPETLISIDTVHASIARESLEAGASIINDISCGKIDPGIHQVAADSNAPYILMHIQGLPETMQVNPQYENVTLAVMDFFVDKIKELNEMGVYNIILDPGFGFGKTLGHNYELLNNLHLFSQFGYPVLAGVSRKSMINRLIKTQPDTALNGTSVVHTLALQKGSDILRVHDVKEAREVITIMDYLESGLFNTA